MAPHGYTRLPGRRVGVFHRDTLWVGDDHLLIVHSHRFSERYRRFYFRDIQAISLQARKFTGFSVIDSVIATLAAVLIVFGFFNGREGWAALLLLISSPYVILRALRCTCTTYLQTAVSVEKLPSLRRIRPATRALGIIERHVREAQLNLPAPFEASSAPTIAGPAVPKAPALVMASKPPSRLLLAGFVLLFLTGSLQMVSPFVSLPAIDWLMATAYGVTAASIGVAMMRGPRLTEIPKYQVVGILFPLLVTGSLATWSFSFLSDGLTRPQQNRVLESIARVLAASVPLRLVLGTLFVVLAFNGLYAFRGLLESPARNAAGEQA